MASIKKVKVDGKWTGKWRARVRRPGSPPQSKNFRLQSDAEAWARGIEGEIERGIWHNNVAAEETTLGEAITRYEKDVLPKKRGQRGESSILRMLKKEPLARMAMARIKSANIAETRDHWLRAGLKPGSIHRRFHTLSHVFTVAWKEWRMEGLVNPVRGVTLPREDNARERRVGADELDAIRAAGAETEHLDNFITLALETAMRREELVTAEWQYANLKARTLFVPKTKNGMERTVPLSTRTVEALAAMRGDKKRGRVFTGWTTPDAATQAFVRAARRARKRYVEDCEARKVEPDGAFLVNVRLHDLRHEAISRMAAIPGLGVHQLAKITGHKTLKMLMRYYNPSGAELAKLLP